MLVDHADAEGLRVPGIAHERFAPVEHELALVGDVEAHDAFDERRLAGAVLAQQRMKRTRRNLDRHVLKSAQRAERLAHADRFERRRARGGVRGCHGSASMKAFERADRAEYAALHLDHLQRSQVIAVIGRGAAVFEQHAFEAAIVRLAHGGMDADVGRDPRKRDIVDSAGAQHQLEVGGAEGSLARLVDHGLARQRLQFVDDLPAKLPAHENFPARPGVADSGADPLRSPALVGRQVRKIRTMTFARVDDEIALGTGRRREAPGSVRSARASAKCRSPSPRHSRPCRRSRSACR